MLLFREIKKRHWQKTHNIAHGWHRHVQWAAMSLDFEFRLSAQSNATTLSYGILGGLPFCFFIFHQNDKPAEQTRHTYAG